MSVPRLSDTSLRYIAALYDPRATYEEAWVPRDAQLSLKQKIFARGSFATGTTGYGGIVVGACLANDIAFVTASTATTAATSTDAISAWTNTTTAPRLNSQFATADYIAGQLQGRVVGMAVYIRYAGTAQNQGGSVVFASHPEGTSLLGYSYTSSMGLDGVHREDVTTGWQHIAWLPTQSLSREDYEFGAVLGQITITRSFGFFVSSAGATQPFDYEIYAWVENTSEAARGQTISFNDPIGFDAITGAIEQFGQLDSVESLQGLVKAVESQLMNQSLPATSHPMGNWVGLLSFLPALKALAMPALKAAGNSILTSLSDGTAQRLLTNGVDVPKPVVRAEKTKIVVPAVVKKKVRPPPRQVVEKVTVTEGKKKKKNSKKK